MKEEQHNKKVQNKRKKAEVENLRCRNRNGGDGCKIKQGMQDDYQNIRKQS